MTLSIETLFPKPIQPACARVVSFVVPEDEVDVADYCEPTHSGISGAQRIKERMQANPNQQFCGSDFAGISQRAACNALKRLAERGLIRRVEDRYTGGRRAWMYQWI